MERELCQLIKREEVYDIDTISLDELYSILMGCFRILERSKGSLKENEYSWRKKAIKLMEVMDLELQERKAVEEFGNSLVSKQAEEEYFNSLNDFGINSNFSMEKFKVNASDVESESQIYLNNEQKNNETLCISENTSHVIKLKDLIGGEQEDRTRNSREGFSRQLSARSNLFQSSKGMKNEEFQEFMRKTLSSTLVNSTKDSPLLNPFGKLLIHKRKKQKLKESVPVASSILFEASKVKRQSLQSNNLSQTKLPSQMFKNVSRTLKASTSVGESKISTQIREDKSEGRGVGGGENNLLKKQKPFSQITIKVSEKEKIGVHIGSKVVNKPRQDTAQSKQDNLPFQQYLPQECSENKVENAQIYKRSSKKDEQNKSNISVYFNSSTSTKFTPSTSLKQRESRPGTAQKLNNPKQIGNSNSNNNSNYNFKIKMDIVENNKLYYLDSKQSNSYIQNLLQSASKPGQQAEESTENEIIYTPTVASITSTPTVTANKSLNANRKLSYSKEKGYESLREPQRNIFENKLQEEKINSSFESSLKQDQSQKQELLQDKKSISNDPYVNIDKEIRQTKDDNKLIEPLQFKFVGKTENEETQISDERTNQLQFKRKQKDYSSGREDMYNPIITSKYSCHLPLTFNSSKPLSSQSSLHEQQSQYFSSQSRLTSPSIFHEQIQNSQSPFKEQQEIFQYQSKYQGESESIPPFIYQQIKLPSLPMQYRMQLQQSLAYIQNRPIQDPPIKVSAHLFENTQEKQNEEQRLQSSYILNQQAKISKIKVNATKVAISHPQNKHLEKIMQVVGKDEDLVDYSHIFTSFNSLFSSFYLSQENSNISNNNNSCNNINNNNNNANTNNSKLISTLESMIEIQEIFTDHVEKVDSNPQADHSIQVSRMAISYHSPSETQNHFEILQQSNNININFSSYFSRQIMQKQNLSNKQDKKIKKNTQPFFRVVKNKTEVFQIVSKSFLRRTNWAELPHAINLKTSWNLLWTWAKPQIDFKKLIFFQKVNHFPQNKNISRKDLLLKNLRLAMKLGSKAANEFDIMPLTFLLPKESTLFSQEFINQQVQISQKNLPNTSNLWIIKPTSSSQGKGIFLINDIAKVSYSEQVVAQKYLQNPFLIKGHKFDMRIYVLVTSFNPLEAFLYKEGFARLSTVPYTLKETEIENRFIHLTNYAIQKESLETCSSLGGSKMSLKMLRKQLESDGVQWSTIWQQVEEIIIKSLVACQPQIPNNPNSFELFGYDIIIDKNIKCWLLEVNASPSLGTDYLLDDIIKQQLVDDIIDLVQPIEFDRNRLVEVLSRRIKEEQGHKSTLNTLNHSKLQLNRDLNYILNKQQIRQIPQESPTKLGEFQQIAPSESSKRLECLINSYKKYYSNSKQPQQQQQQQLINISINAQTATKSKQQQSLQQQQQQQMNNTVNRTSIQINKMSYQIEFTVQ